jgi:hypothetical protein
MYLLSEGEENTLSSLQPSVKKFRVLSGDGLTSIIELVEIGFLTPVLGTSMGNIN